MDILLRKLLNAFGTSGSEEKVKLILKDELKNTNCNINEDKAGNLIVKIGEGNEKLMFCANMDEVGFIVTYMEENGFARIDGIGDINLSESVSNFVRFKNGINGRISSSKSSTDISDLYIDFGINSKDKLLKFVKEGDTACFSGHSYEYGDMLVSSALDNRIGCFILLKMIKQIKKPDKELYFVFSSQGELGGRGARAAAFNIKPDLCFVVDLEEAGDELEGKGSSKLGCGPILKIMDGTLIMNHKIKEILENKANEKGIAIQHVVSASKTDGGTIHKENGGIRTGVLAIPCRYNHTASEMVNMKDVEACLELLTSII